MLITFTIRTLLVTAIMLVGGSAPVFSRRAASDRTQPIDRAQTRRHCPADTRQTSTTLPAYVPGLACARATDR